MWVEDRTLVDRRRGEHVKSGSRCSCDCAVARDVPGGSSRRAGCRAGLRSRAAGGGGPVASEV